MDRDDKPERLAEAQYEASSTIYGSSDPVEILNAIVNFGGKAFADAHLGLLDAESPDSQILNIIAVRDANGIRAESSARRLDEYPAHETLSAVESLYIADVATDPFLTVQERALVQGQGFEAMLVIPLVVGQRLIGLIDFTSPHPVELSTPILRAMRSLADQIAVVFENQSLLRSTATTLEEVQALYDMNQAMLGALNPLDILDVLRSRLAQTASLTHLVVERNTDNAESIVIRHVITPTEEKAVEIPTDGQVKAADLFGEAETTSVVFVEDVDKAGEKEKTLLHEILKAESTRSFIAIVVRDHGVIKDFITITYDYAQVFDSQIRRLYNAVADEIGIVLQNQRLLRDAQAGATQLKQQISVLQGLNRLSTGISSFQDEKALLDYAAQTLMMSLNVEHVWIMVFDSGAENGRITSEYPAKDTVGVQVDIRSSKIVTALRDAPDRPMVVHNLEHSIQVELEMRQRLRKMGIYSLMAIGLRSSGQLIGMVNFDLYDETSQFAPDMIEIAQTMVAQIATGLQNIRLLTDAERRADQLQRIATFGQSVQATLKLDTILNIVLSESRAMIPIDRMSIALYDTRQSQLRVVGQYEDQQVSIDLENGALISMTGTFVGYVWETQELLAISDTQAVVAVSRMQDVHLASWALNQFDSRIIKAISRSQDISMRSVMVAPVRVRGHMIGTVSVGCLLPASYAETDQAIFRQMVNQLAVAIENADAYTQSQRVAQNEALINEIATHFQQHTNVEDMLQIAVNELGRALGARRGRIRLSMESSRAGNGN